MLANCESVRVGFAPFAFFLAIGRAISWITVCGYFFFSNSLAFAKSALDLALSPFFSYAIPRLR